MNSYESDAFSLLLSPRQRASDLEGKTLGSWKLLETLSSSGGFSVVYRACHTREEMGNAAVKVFAFDANENPEIRPLFGREIEVLRKLTVVPGVRGVPRIFDAGIEPTGLPWIAMQFIEGKPLDVWLHQARLEFGHLESSAIVQILNDILGALMTIQGAYTEAAADPGTVTPSAAGIIHRDIKPGNVLIENTASGLRAWVVDFGIARIIQPGRGATASMQSA